MTRQKTVDQLRTEYAQADRVARALASRANQYHKQLAGLLPVDKQIRINPDYYRTISRRAIDARKRADQIRNQIDRAMIKAAAL